MSSRSSSSSASGSSSTAATPQPTNHIPSEPYEFIDTIEACAALSRAIVSDVPTPIGVDCEGVNLGRDGELCILTIALRSKVYLVDITVLGEKAFTRGGLHSVLSNDRVTKYFFDCRQDADALHSHYGVKLRNVVDLQYSSCQYFGVPSQFLIGLRKALDKLDCATPDDRRIKDEGSRLFSPEMGGNYDLWKMRPLNPTLIQYSVVDVKYFFKLASLTSRYERQARSVANIRVKRAEGPAFRPAIDGTADWQFYPIPSPHHHHQGGDDHGGYFAHHPHDMYGYHPDYDGGHTHLMHPPGWDGYAAAMMMNQYAAGMMMMQQHLMQHQMYAAQQQQQQRNQQRAATAAAAMAAASTSPAASEAPLSSAASSTSSIGASSASSSTSTAPPQQKPDPPIDQKVNTTSTNRKQKSGNSSARRTPPPPPPQHPSQGIHLPYAPPPQQRSPYPSADGTVYYNQQRR